VSANEADVGFELNNIIRQSAQRTPVNAKERLEMQRQRHQRASAKAGDAHASIAPL